MESRTRVIVGFLVLALIVWGIMLVSDWLVPHAKLLEHVLHVTLAVVPPFTAYVIFTIRALEKRRRAEEALLKSEEKYRLIFETAANLITSVNRDGIIVDCNTRIQSLLGYTPEEIIGQPMAKIIHPDYLDKANESLGEILAKGFSYDKEYKFIRKDGALIDLSINSSGLKNEKGEYYRTICIISDITERKRAEEEITKFKTATDIASIGVTMGPIENLGYVNKAFAEMHGYSPDELIGKHYSILYTDEQLLVINRVRERLFKEGNFAGEEVWHKRKDGTVFPTLMMGTLIRDAEGNPSVITGTVIDITERRKMEEQLQQSLLLASLGEMTAGIAHEVNNPLGIILLHSELLKAGNLPAPAKRDLKVIHDEAKRAARIVSDLLAYSRGNSPKVKRTNLNKILGRVVEMRSYQERVQNISLTTDLESGPLYIKGNSSQLTQVFINLLLNAEEALQKSRGARIIITTRIDGGRAKVSVADNGTGIPEDRLNQVFHPFYTTKEVGKGTGLGLSNCFGIISSHGGLIRAENNEMGGATFTIELPLASNKREKGEAGNENGAS